MAEDFDTVNQWYLQIPKWLDLLDSVLPREFNTKYGLVNRTVTHNYVNFVEIRYFSDYNNTPVDVFYIKLCLFEGVSLIEKDSKRWLLRNEKNLQKIRKVLRDMKTSLQLK